ncbi:lytic transglycosylase domain-containing protein [Agromyces lapidis]|uniref:Lytic transglycosylase domain-containing protein n=1 Tax=Agromyces lapidis TaxID=279574 RepID=A0ABV5SPN1_9MICO|nr:lytic transglycosylase domain-containing protein [Agromyces lapidis]
MGRHNGADAAAQQAPVTRSRPTRGPVKQAASVLFAFFAASGLVLVNIVDPYSGATASAEFAFDGDRFDGESAQSIAAGTGYEVTLGGPENYVVEEKPEVVVVPASSGSGWAPPAVTPDPGSAQAYAAGAVAARGWGAGEFDCLVALWNKESGWNVNAYNAGSGAYGIPQALPGSKMATAGADWETNAGTQIEWGLGYISGRYGTPCGAWGHSESVGWY